MVHLSETERTELMIIGYGEKRRNFAQVVTLFNEIHPERELIFMSTVQKPYKDLMKLEVLKNVQNLAGQKLLQVENHFKQ